MKEGSQMIVVECRLSVSSPKTVTHEGWDFTENAFWDYERYGCWVKGPCGEQYEFLPKCVGECETRTMCGYTVIAERVEKGLLKITVK
jgi:hypothetical protein